MRQSENRDFTVKVEDIHFHYSHVAGESGSLYGLVQTRSEPDTVEVLSQVSFQAYSGTVTLLCGASGSGKSTVLRLLNGLVPNFHAGMLDGSVCVCGVDVPSTDLSEAGRTTSTVFQDPRTQFFTMDVRSDLAFRGESYGLAPEVIRQNCEQAVRRVGIENLVGRSLRSLSCGELQKVACAQALAGGTDVLLFDEPTSNLSPAAITDFARLLRDMKASGHTIVIAEHRLYFLRTIADQVIHFDQGHIAHRWDHDQFAALTSREAERLGLRTLDPPSTRSVFFAAEKPTGLTLNPTSGDISTEEPSTGKGLTLNDIRFSYGHCLVVDIPNLAFPSGQVTALIGPNGAGKTTLARLICGLATEERGGRIALDGTVVNARNRLRVSAMVMQDVNRQLFSDTVRDEVTLGAKRDTDACDDADSLLARFDLQDLADRHPLSLSGGQKQRLVIAAAVARNARVCLFDEPTSGVDRRHLEAISRQLTELAQAGKVVIVITHDPELADVCAQRIVTLYPLTLGEIVARTPQRVEITSFSPESWLEPISDNKETEQHA